MAEYNLPQPVFSDNRGSFTVILYNSENNLNASEELTDIPDPKKLVDFCRIPRSRAEIIDYIGISSGQYALKHYLEPLLACGVIQMSIPDKPKSEYQKYVTKER